MVDFGSYFAYMGNNIRYAILGLYIFIVRFSPLPDVVDAIIILVLIGFAVYKIFKLLLAR